MILVYHNISTKAGNENTVSLYFFILHMLFLRLKGYNVVYLDEYKPDIKKQIVITFDDGYKSVVKYAGKILKILKFPFEVFVCEKLVNKPKYISENDFKSIINFGGRLEYHSKSHIDLTNLCDVSILDCEIILPKQYKIYSSEHFKYFAYPYWKNNSFVVDIVKKYYSGARSGNGYADYSKWSMDSMKVHNDYNIIKQIREYEHK